MIQKMIQALKKYSVMNITIKIAIGVLFCIAGMTATLAQGLDLNEEHNYMLSVQAQEPFTTVKALETAPEAQKIYNITYADGLGRPVQQNAINASPDSKDIILHVEYDVFGRQAKQYLPYEAGKGVTGSYREVDIQKDIHTYYQNRYPKDFTGVPLDKINACSETIFEASPLNRAREQAAPGAAWAYNKKNLNYTNPVYANFPATLTYLKQWDATDILYTTGVANALADKENRVSIRIESGSLILWMGVNQSLGIQTLPVGKLRKLDVYPAIAYLDMGYITDSNGANTDYKASIENNYFVITAVTSTPGSVVNGLKTRKTFDISQLQYLKSYETIHSANHTVKLAYDLNTATEVMRFDVVMVNNTPSLVANGTYAAAQLTKRIIKNENWTLEDGKNKTAEAFTDKSGQTVLSRAYNNEQVLDTYNVYDDFGNLTYVIPPKVITTDGISNTELTELIYQYKYDERNRIIEKKAPGKGWEYIIYNELDQPILTQNASLRKDHTGKPSDQWLFVKYDALGRGVYSGIYTDSRDRTTIQQEVNALATLWEQRDVTTIINGTKRYYSNTTFPTTNIELHSMSYYDDYNFDKPVELYDPQTVYQQATSNRTKMLPTGGKVRILGTDTWITTVTYYDKKARPVYVANKNEYLSTVDILETKFDFAGKVIQSKTTHTKNSNTAIVTVDTFAYDHQGRVLTQTQKINDQPEEVIMSNTYDKLGILTRKETGGGLQKVDYSHNIRGWLTAINEGDTANGDLFGYAIHYNNPTENLGATALYNGNISEITWKTANDHTQRAYGYIYDALDRLTTATSKDGRYDVSGITYDTMGNILSLNRKGHTDINATAFGEMDKLSYTYEATGHKLLRVTDTGNITFGFKDGNTTGNDYEYDSNGSITVDKNKGITNIKYNHLDLPVEIVFDNNSTKKINYIYDATGGKQKKIITDRGTTTVTEYAGGAQYKNGNLEFMPHAEGYIEPSDTGYRYTYQYADHLGNIRLSYTDKNDDGTITTDEIVEESNYYPFGLQQKGYNAIKRGAAHQIKYNSTELEESLGLNWYEMPLRSYDPTIARWNRIDPITHHGLSTYNAFGNNPVYYNDPSGGSHHEIREGRMVNSGDYRNDGRVSYNWNTGQYENSNGDAVSFGTALSSVGVSIDTNRNRGLSGISMLNRALAQFGLSASAHTKKKEKWVLSFGDTEQEFGEGWDNWDDNITVNKDGIVTNVEKNNQAHRFFDEDGNELFFSDPDVDFEFINEWLEGDRLFFSISDSELLSAILKQGGINPLLLRSTGNISGAWIAAALTSHSGADFTFSHLVSNYFTSTERKNLDTGFLRTSYHTNFHFFRFGNTNRIYNLYDAGNYMWGSWMNFNRFSSAAIKFGSQVNSIFTLNGIDSSADQGAIINGFNHFRK